MAMLLQDRLRLLLARCNRSGLRRCASSSARCAGAGGDGDEVVYDAVIVGGGVVGAALACRLLEGGHALRLALVDPAAGTQPSLREIAARGREVVDPRVYALSPRSVALLRECGGAWEKVEREERRQEYHSMQVWNADGPGFVRFTAQGALVPALGTIAENATVQAALWEELQRFQSAGKGVKADADADADANRIDILRGSVDSIWAPKSWKEAGQLAAVRVVDGEAAESAASMTELRARLVIGADGGNSAVKRLLHVPAWGWGYGQRGLVCTVRCARPHTTAWQRFLPHGPLALLPLWDDLSSIVWSTSPEEAQRLTALPEEEFLRELNDALVQAPVSFGSCSHSDHEEREEHGEEQDVGGEHEQPRQHRRRRGPRGLRALRRRLGRAFSEAAEGIVNAGALNAPFEMPPTATAVLGPRPSFPLRIEQAMRYTQPRVALIGDAAHTIHPMAGQGLNLGLQDVDCLVRVLQAATRTGGDWGDVTALKQYERERMQSNTFALTGLEILHRLYYGRGDEHLTGGSCHRLGPLEQPVVRAVATARNVGMGVLNALDIVKTQIARGMTGAKY